jgi:hypothetical protein
MNHKLQLCHLEIPVQCKVVLHYLLDSKKKLCRCKILAKVGVMLSSEQCPTCPVKTSLILVLNVCMKLRYKCLVLKTIDPNVAK